MMNFVMLMNHGICLDLVMFLDNVMCVAAMIGDVVGLLPSNFVAAIIQDCFLTLISHLILMMIKAQIMEGMLVVEGMLLMEGLQLMEGLLVGGFVAGGVPDDGWSTTDDGATTEDSYAKWSTDDD